MKTLYILSDLHLAGPLADPGEAVTAMCPPTWRHQLARFVHHIMEEHKGQPADNLELLINGDAMDFLAVEPQSPFTADPDMALAKLEQVLAEGEGDKPTSWCEALREFLRAGHRLTWLLGNHDLELSLPPLRDRLRHALTAHQPGHFEFIHDGEACRRGQVLVEHGNRYDGWNAVAFSTLRNFRDRLSHGERPKPFTAPPGSRLVVNVLKELKETYWFIDLLKPVDEAAVRMVMALESSLALPITEILGLILDKKINSTQPGHPPTLRGSEQSPAMAMQEGFPDDILSIHKSLSRGFLQELASCLSPSEATAVPSDRKLRGHMDMSSLYQDRRPLRGGQDNLERARKLYPIFAKYHQEIRQTSQLDWEEPIYEQAANRLSQDTGCGVVCFGHTHLPRLMNLTNGGIYVNCGSWCQVMTVPEQILSEGVPLAARIEHLREFLDLVTHSSPDQVLSRPPTFARIVQGDQGVTVEICHYRDGGIHPMQKKTMPS